MVGLLVLGAVIVLSERTVRNPMKPNESNIAVERERHEAELPELAVRILSDFARIVAAEARLLESNIVEAANTLVDRVYIAAILDRARRRRCGGTTDQRGVPPASLDAVVAGAGTGRACARFCSPKY